MRQQHRELAPNPTPDAQLRRSLERGGWRVTRQRAAVYDFLRSVESHPTAEEVYFAVRADHPRISLATVYKALEALVDCGLASKITYSDGAARFDCHTDGHYHCRCLKTGQIRDLPASFDPDLLDKIDPHLVEQLQRQGFHVTGYRLEVLGHFDDGKADRRVSTPTPS